MKLPFLKSSKTTEAEVPEKIFGVEINKDLIAQLIKVYIENSHPGTKAQKNRSAVRGGGKKPWRQKGTGRARAGTSRSPLWRGGGVVFPASTKSAKPKKLNKKMYKSAMRSIFSSLAKENRVFLSDQINIENPKTKDFVDFLKKNELKEGLFIVDEISNNLSLASRNLPNVNVTNLNTLNPINLLKFNSVVIAENCLNLIEEKLS
ncbi:MAG: 50S ribosomal protein L4 [SAR86 cluster bacterium]|uniref:Large ribosomal subunit protein uL4 n=1 Tax=SAR86 cluster bacterium TaxID=2030880 RepID=A0A937I0D5_9GAMM|nr:50S ribosomal protein L4 [Gammaproteobacteria bacterium]MBL6811755.1 50S ribosomal protein L4 [SAR86 cluster bacterium]|tara:strand:- start:3462 stop:4076 length:615 start_codon:yes stop_codon:yes gene_type:complete